MEIYAAKIRVRAERKAGELLKEIEKASGRRTDLESNLVPQIDQVETPPPKTLKEMGITKNQSSDWQKAADIPEQDFEKAIDDTIEKRGSLTTRNIVKKDVVAFTGEYEWYTPGEYVALARAVMGGINLDPASCEKANETVQADQYFTVQQDGIAQPWIGKVWLNPPYCQPQIAQFTNKLIDDYRSGNVTAAILLTNNSSDTEWFQRAAKHCRAMCLPKSRIRFDGPTKGKSTPLRGQTFFYFGRDLDLFIANFSSVGVITSCVNGA